jgi:hypothetical protein
VVTSVGAYDQIGGALGDLEPFVGMNVTLSTDADYDLVVAVSSPYIPPVAGSGGSPSLVLAASSPTTYDFSSSPIVWTLTYQGGSRTISLASNYVNMSGVVSAISSQLAGIGLTAQDSSGRLLIAEPSSPYKGGVLSQSNAPVALFGVGPIYTVGYASQGGVPEQAAYIALQYENGEPFAGLDDGAQRLSLGYRDHRYQTTALNALTMTVKRLTDAGVADAVWAGFTARTLLDFALGSDDTGSLNWLARSWPLSIRKPQRKKRMHSLKMTSCALLLLLVLAGCASQEVVVPMAATCPVPPSAPAWAMQAPSNSLQLLDQLFFPSEPELLPTKQP